jgi:Transposase
MARAIFLNLRERVVGAVSAGESCRSVAATFKVSVASVVKWSQRFRSEGIPAAHKVGGRRTLCAGWRAGIGCSSGLPFKRASVPHRVNFAAGLDTGRPP